MLDNIINDSGTIRIKWLVVFARAEAMFFVPGTFLVGCSGMNV